MASKTETCKIPITGSQSVCILNSEWANEVVKLLLLHDNRAWGGTFQVSGDEDFSDLIDQLSLTEHQYMEETKRALTTQGGAQDFFYTIENNVFTWKKSVKNMTIKFGYVTLENANVCEVFERMIDNILESNIATTETLAIVHKKKESLEEENIALKTKLTELCDKKNDFEMTLYGQFLCVLNEKKKKIRELQKKLGVPEANDDDLDPVHRESDHFDSDTEIDSEEESKSKIVQTKSTELSDTEEEEIICALPKRRARQLDSAAAIKKQSGTSRNFQDESKSTVLKKTAAKSGKKKTVKDAAAEGIKNPFYKNPFEGDEKNSSEEDPFTFPKRPKRGTSTKQPVIGATAIKSSTRKISYESDDENKPSPPLKMEDMDITPDLIDICDNIKGKNIERNTNMDESVEENKNKIQKSTSKEDRVTKGSFNNYSSSTLDLLNRLA